MDLKLCDSIETWSSNCNNYVKINHKMVRKMFVRKYPAQRFLGPSMNVGVKNEMHSTESFSIKSCVRQNDVLREAKI
jgi:hypothetical protein